MRYATDINLLGCRYNVRLGTENDPAERCETCLDGRCGDLDYSTSLLPKFMEWFNDKLRCYLCSTRLLKSSRRQRHDNQEAQ